MIRDIYGIGRGRGIISGAREGSNFQSTCVARETKKRLGRGK